MGSGVLTIEDLEEAFAGIERTRIPAINMLEVRCPFYGCESVLVREQLESVSDFCPQCLVVDDCKEIAFAPKAIECATDPAQLPQYLASKLELIRILAIDKLRELLRGGGIAMEVRRYPYYRPPQKSGQLCACGCGLFADYGSRFRHGHSAKKRRRRSQQMHHRRKSKS